MAEISEFLSVVLVAAIAIASTKYLALAGGSTHRLGPLMVESFRHTPGTMIASLILPSLFDMGSIGIMAGIMSVAVALATRSMVATIVAGAASAALLRLLGT